MPNTLTDYFFNAQSIYIYNNGVIKKNDKNILINNIKTLTKGAYYSPAYATAINQQVIKQKQSGIWLEFNYNKNNTFAGLTFSKLLIEIKPDLFGINIIRYNEKHYAGRCYYLNLTTNTTDFYNFLHSIE